MVGHPLDQHVQRHGVFAALRDDQVGLALAGLHKLLVHRLDGGQVLGHHAVQRAAAAFYVPDDAPQNAHVGVGVHKHLDVHQVAQLLAGKDQDALHNDDRRGVHRHRLVAAVVDGVVVHRHADALAGAQLLQVLHHQVGVKAVRVVVVELAAFLVGQLVVALVVAVVVDDADFLLAKMLPQPPRQGGLAAAGAAGDADHDGVHVPSASSLFCARCFYVPLPAARDRALTRPMSAPARWGGRPGI